MPALSYFIQILWPKMAFVCQSVFQHPSILTFASTIISLRFYGTKWPLCANVPLSYHPFVHSYLPFNQFLIQIQYTECPLCAEVPLSIHSFIIALQPLFHSDCMTINGVCILMCLQASTHSFIFTCASDHYFIQIFDTLAFVC